MFFITHSTVVAPLVSIDWYLSRPSQQEEEEEKKKRRYDGELEGRNSARLTSADSYFCFASFLSLLTAIWLTEKHSGHSLSLSLEKSEIDISYILWETPRMSHGNRRGHCSLAILLNEWSEFTSFVLVPTTGRPESSRRHDRSRSMRAGGEKRKQLRFRNPPDQQRLHSPFGQTAVSVIGC